MSFIGNIEVQTFSGPYKFMRLNTDCDRCKFRHPMWLNKKQALQFLYELSSEIRKMEDTDDDQYDVEWQKREIERVNQLLSITELDAKRRAVRKERKKFC